MKKILILKFMYFFVLGHYSSAQITFTYDTNGNQISRTALNTRQKTNIAANGATTFCIGDSVRLTATSGTSTATYKWSNGQTTPSVFANATGVYSVTVTEPEGCAVIGTQNIIVVPKPTPDIAGALSVCQGGSTLLTASGGATYKWSNNATTASIIVANTGTYSVTVTNETGCSSVISKTVIANPNTAPTAIIEGSTEICETSQGSTPTRLVAKGGISYYWSNNTNSDAIVVNKEGIYSVAVTGNNGCTAVASKTVTKTKVIGAISTQPATPICPGDNVQLIASGGTNYIWQTGATTTSISANPLSTSDYTVVVSTGLCSDIAKQTIKVYPKPNAVIEGIAELCDTLNSPSTTLTAKGGVQYVWSTGMTTPSITVNRGGVYTVTITNAEGCKATTSQQVVVTKLDANITVQGGTTVCAGDQVTLKAAGGGTYTWSNGINGVQINVTPNTTTEYKVTINSNNCSVVKSQVITITKEKSNVSFNYQKINNKVIFTNTSSNDVGNFSWRFDNGETSNQKDPLPVIYKNIKQYQVCVTGKANGKCDSTHCQTINISVGLDNLPENLFVSIGPNPTTGSVDVILNYTRSFNSHDKITVKDVLGRTIYTLNSLQKTNHLDITNALNGIYFLYLTLEDKTYHLEKIVKSD